MLSFDFPVSLSLSRCSSSRALIEFLDSVEEWKTISSSILIMVMPKVYAEVLEVEFWKVPNIITWPNVKRWRVIVWKDTGW